MVSRKHSCSDHPSAPILKSQSIIDVLRRRAERAPDDLAYTFLANGERQEAALTYGLLEEQARAIGALLASVNATRERVLVVYPPGLDYVAAFLGCLYAGAVAVPVYPPDRASQWRGSETSPRTRGPSPRSRSLPQPQASTHCSNKRRS